MGNFGQAMPVSVVPLLTALLHRQRAYRTSLSFNRHMTLYSTMVCFINLVLKSMTLSYTPDPEHI